MQMHSLSIFNAFLFCQCTSLWLTGLFLRLRQSNAFEVWPKFCKSHPEMLAGSWDMGAEACEWVVGGWGPGCQSVPCCASTGAFVGWVLKQSAAQCVRQLQARISLSCSWQILSFPPQPARMCQKSRVPQIPGFTSIHSATELFSFAPDLKFIFADETRLFPLFFPPTLVVNAPFHKLVPYPIPSKAESLYGRLLHLLASSAESHKSVSRHFAYLLKLKYIYFEHFLFYWLWWQRFLLLPCFFIILKIL